MKIKHYNLCDYMYNGASYNKNGENNGFNYLE